MLHSFQKWFFSKARLQIFSIIVAFVAWFAVHSGQQIQERVIFEIRYENLDPQLIFKREPPKEFRLILQGSLNRLKGIMDEPKVYVVDLSRAEEGRDVFDIDLSQLDLPLDVRAENPIPQSIEIQLEKLEKREVMVKLEPRGTPAKGFALTSFRVFPQSIEVFGPASILQTLSDIRLPVSIDQKKESFSLPLALELHSALKASVPQVIAEFKIAGITREKELKEVKVQASGGIQKTLITPQTARIVLRGSEDQLKKISDNILVEVPVEGLNRGRYRIRGELKLIEGVQLVSISPESFIVEVIE